MGLRYQPASGYTDDDTDGPAALPVFSSPSGIQLPENFHPTCESEFFKPYFTEQIVDSIARFTNCYAEVHLTDKPSHANKDKEWDAIDSAEMYKLIALLLFQSYNRLPASRDYWRTSSLFCGNNAHAIIPSRR